MPPRDEPSPSDNSLTWSPQVLNLNYSATHGARMNLKLEQVAQHNSDLDVSMDNFVSNVQLGCSWDPTHPFKLRLCPEVFSLL